MTIYIQNKFGVVKDLAGKTFQIDEYRDVTSVAARFANNDEVLTGIGAGDVIVARTDDGNNDITSIAQAMNYLRELPPTTENGLPQSQIEVREEFIPTGYQKTGGKYQARSYEIVVDQAQGAWKELDVVFPYPISIFSTEWIEKPEFEGDELQVLALPDTITGALSANVAAGATVIDVSQTVIDNTALGYNLKLDDGTNIDDMGRVFGIDKDNLKLTMETATTNAFLASSPTYCKQSIEFVPHICLSGLGRVELAKDVVGGSYIPANAILRIRYRNNEGSTTNKVFSAILEYKY